jgi:GT2 family glycosyltransferase
VSSVTEIVSVVQPKQQPPRGRIDLPEPGATVYGDRLEVEGWALDESSPAGGIEALMDGRVVGRARLDVPRPDVSAAHPNYPEASLRGFLLEIDIPTPMAFDLHLHAACGDEKRRPLGVIQARRRTRSLPDDGPLVSIVIPCHNQAPFIADAIRSVRAQTYRNLEVVVVDDGSVDESAMIAESHGVRVVRQERSGPSGARNAGFRVTSGDFVVFLDGDNLLQPHALEANLHGLEDHPESAFVGGRYTYIDEQGARERSNTLPAPRTPNDHYAALLAENYFGSPDNVMFRRSVLDVVGLFDSAVDGLEDYDLYLRIAKEYPVYYHGVTVSKYRVHESQFSRDQAMMLRSVVTVLRRQKSMAARDPALQDAYRRGLASWRAAYGGPLANQLRTRLRQRRWSEARSMAATLLRSYPTGLVNVVSEPLKRRVARSRRFER